MNWFHALCLFSLGLMQSTGLSAAPPDQPTTKRDAVGDPLPDGAIMRFGSNRLRQRHAVNGVAFAPDGKHIITTSLNPAKLEEGRIQVWNVPDGTTVERWTTNSPYMFAQPQFSPDGKYLVGMDFVGRHGVYEVAARKTIWSNNSRDTRVIRCSPDGSKLALGRKDGIVRLIDIKTGEKVLDCEAQNKAVVAVAFSENGKELTAVIADFSTCRFDAQSGKLLMKEDFPKEVAQNNPLAEARTACSADGKRVAIAKSEGFVVWTWIVGDKSAKTITAEAIKSSCGYLSISGDGQLLATGHGDSAVRVWKTATGELVREWERSGLTAEPVISLGGERVAVFENNTTQLWDVATGKLLAPAQPDANPRLAAVIGHGKTVVTTSFADGTITAWDSATGKAIDRYETDANGISALATAKDGNSIRGLDNLFQEVLWQPGKPGETRMRSVNFTTRSKWEAAYSSDGEWTAVRLDGAIGVYDVQTNEEIKNLKWDGDSKRDSRLHFSPDRRWLLCENDFQGVWVWEIQTGRLHMHAPSWRTTSAKFSVDGRLLFCRDKVGILVWEIASRGELLKICCEPENLLPQAVSPNHSILLATTTDGDLVVINLHDGKEIKRIPAHVAMVNFIEFTPDGRHFLSASDDSTAILWDAARFNPRSVDKAETNEETIRLWMEDLGSPDAAKAANAVRLLAFHPQTTLKAIGNLVKDVPDEPSKRIARLIGQLDHDRFKLREEAVKELAAYGMEAKTALEISLKRPPSEDARLRMEGLMARLKGENTVPPFLREFRLIETFEHMGSKEAQNLLREMAKGSNESPVVREAAAVLKRWNPEEFRKEK